MCSPLPVVSADKRHFQCPSSRPTLALPNTKKSLGDAAPYTPVEGVFRVHRRRGCSKPGIDAQVPEREAAMEFPVGSGSSAAFDEQAAERRSRGGLARIACSDEAFTLLCFAREWRVLPDSFTACVSVCYFFRFVGLFPLSVSICSRCYCCVCTTQLQCQVVRKSLPGFFLSPWARS